VFGGNLVDHCNCVINDSLDRCFIVCSSHAHAFGSVMGEGLHASGGVCKASGMLGSPLRKRSIRFTRPEKLV
jgi:hypothetical protein